MIVSKIVECICGELVFLPGPYSKKLCPNCNIQIVSKIDENPFVITDKGSVPILPKYAYHPSNIKYFYDDNYPENGKEILCVYQSYKAKFFVWEEIHKIAYEKDYYEKGIDKMFFWKYLDK